MSHILWKYALLKETFRRYSSFLSHLQRKHRGLDIERAARRIIGIGAGIDRDGEPEVEVPMMSANDHDCRESDGCVCVCVCVCM